MRGNGLSADEYVAVADLDPGTADLLLAALRDRGVAAYAAESPDPAPLEVGTVDRLYVDVAAVEQARALIHDELRHSESADGRDDGSGPDQLGLDFDAEFASIVASYHRPPGAEPAGVARWPVDEDLPPAPPSPTFGRRRDDVVEQGPPQRERRGAETDDPAAAQPGSGATVGWDDVLRPEAGVPAEGSRGATRRPEEEATDDEGYVPPPPPPLPRPDTAARFAWAGVLGGPALLFVAVLLGWHLEDWMMLAAAVAFLAGFVTLVARLGDRDDDGDDGAVV